MIEIRNEDCLEGMKNLKNETVDLILTDPPFNIAQEEIANEKVKKWRGGKILTNGWDKRSEEEFDEFNKKWVSECYRILRPKGWFCVFNHWKNIPDFVKLVKSFGFKYTNLFTWAKTNPAMSFPIGLVQSCEYVIVFYKQSTDSNFTKYLNSKSVMKDYVVQPATSPSEREEGSFHPTIKPKNIIKMFINQFTKENDTVADIFSGSGTVACICAEMNRNFIGFEIDPNYYSQSIRRLSKYKSQTGLKEWTQPNSQMLNEENKK